MRTSTLVLSEEEFHALRRLLARVAGLVFDETRRDSLALCVAERLQATGIGDVASYLVRLDDPTERRRLLDEVTIQETHFFRNPPQIRALRTQVLPELVRYARSHGRRLRVWSAGCATGEEAYTIAMLLREQLPVMAGWDVRVVATDVSERALTSARPGRYGARAVQMVPAPDLARFFTASGDGQYDVRPEIHELVEFRGHNLVTEPVPFHADDRVDLVLCRNVTIYFSRETTRALMERLHGCLRDGGYLFLGHAETLWQVSEDFHLVPLGAGESAAFVYRRRDASAAERRAVLADRRTAELPPVSPERRVAPRRRAGLVPVPRAAAAVPIPSAAAVRAALADGRYDDALRAAAALVDADRLNPDGHYLRGLAYVSSGREAAALVDLRKAVYLEPSAGLAHFLLAGALARVGDRAAAAREYAAAAGTLGRRDADRDAPELGGRAINELIALCRQLCEQLGSSQG